MSDTTPLKRDGVLKNVAWLTAANALSRPAWFLFITAACMRLLGVEQYGEMTVALALAGSVTVLTEFGTNSLSVREISRRPETAAVYFSNFVLGRIALSAIALVMVTVIGVLMGRADAALLALLWASVYTLSLRLIEYCRGIFQALEVLRFEAATLLVEKVLVIGLGLAGLVYWRTASGVLGGMALGIMLTLLLTAGLVHKRFAPFSRVHLSLPFLISSYRLALPIGVYAVATIFLLSSGAIFLEELATSKDVGMFGAAYRILELLLLLPMLICTATLPRLSVLHHRNDSKAFTRVLAWSTASIAIGTLVVAAGIGFFSDLLLQLLGGADYQESAPLLRTMIWAYPWMGLTMLMTQALIFVDEAVFAAGALVISVVFNAVALLVLIPQFGAVAPALTLIGVHALIACSCAARLLYSIRQRPGVPAATLST